MAGEFFIRIFLSTLNAKFAGKNKIFEFQAKVGRKKEFEAALLKLRGKDADISREAAEIQVNFFPIMYWP